MGEGVGFGGSEVVQRGCAKRGELALDGRGQRSSTCRVMDHRLTSSPRTPITGASSLC